MNREKRDITAGILSATLAIIIMFGYAAITGEELTRMMVYGSLILGLGFSLAPWKIWTIPARLVNYVLSSVFS